MITDHRRARLLAALDAVLVKSRTPRVSDKRDLVRGRDALAVWMYEPGRRRRLIGESYGTPVEDVLAEEDDEGKADLRRFEGCRALYVYSTTILQRYEGQGFGKILKAYVLGRAFEAGYQWVVGHAKEGASVALNRFFGAKLLRRHVNWSDTGDAYRFYELKLRSPARGPARRRTHATLFRSSASR